MNPVESLISKIKESDLVGHQDEIIGGSRPSAQVESLDSDRDEIGSSRIGGLPDLPRGTPWPASNSLPEDERDSWTDAQWQGGPLWFLAQINLADLREIDLGKLVLPDSGMLYFFASLHKDGYPDWGVGPTDWKVIHAPETTYLVRSQPPEIDAAYLDGILEYYALPENFVISPRQIQFSQAITIDPWPEFITHSDELRILYRRELQSWAYGEEGAPNNHLGGHPQSFDSPMIPICEEVDAENNAQSETRDWNLLFQCDSDNDMGLAWPGLGKGFFWVPAGADGKANFSDTLLINRGSC